MEQSTFLSEEHPASHSASQVCEVEWMTTVATWHSNRLAQHVAGLENDYEEIEIGLGSPTEFLTLNFTKDADVFSLSDTVYEQDAKACSGILRRAEKRRNCGVKLIWRAWRRCRSNVNGNHAIACNEVAPAVTTGPPFSRLRHQRA